MEEGKSYEEGYGGLVLSRRAGESLIIECDGRVIKIKLSKIVSVSTASFTIKADKDIIVDREEVYIKRKEGWKND